MVITVEKRQDLTQGDSSYYDDSGWWWYSPTAAAIKWAVMALIFFLLLGWFVGGYYHAQRRMKRGLPPLAYHRWLLPRSQRARFEPHLRQPQTQFSYHQAHGMPENTYNMHAIPPPAYNPYHAPPPSYEPPAGASKVDPLQSNYTAPSSGESSNTNHQDTRVTDSTAPTLPHTMGSRNPFR